MRFRLSKYRRVIQAFFFLLFLALLGLAAKQIVLPFPAEFFLLSDPLVALTALLAGVPLAADILFSLVTVVLTLLFGKIFCGYACPMGAFLDLLAPLSRLLNIKRGSFKRLKILPLITLSIVLVMSAFGINFLMLFDPIVSLTRTTTVTVFPAMDFVLSRITESLYSSTALAKFVDTTVVKLTGILMFDGQRSFISAQWMVLLFISIVSLNFLGKRFWCRYLCPLGGLLGIIGSAPFYRRKVAANSCSNCLKCAKVCDMEAVGDKGLKTDAASCLLCLKCRDTCPRDAISLGLKTELTSEMPSRRTAIATVSATAVAAYVIPFKGWPKPDHLTLIRPPGALDESAFLDKCIRCGECLKACPTNVLQPSLFQYGIDALWTPHMDFTVGVCDWSCSACTRVCPTGAIQHLSLEAKHKFVIGRAEIDRSRCIPWLAGHGCMVCEEMCPLPDKAIIIEEASNDRGKVDQRPIMVKKKCIGCGICENKCPVPERKAIKIFPPSIKGGQELFTN
ncbi:MAG TPA: 4Fe-4S binding protein [Anaerolineae bacterium]|nr:4Fe-4S binding protein [Anaerolineae bacterium]